MIDFSGKLTVFLGGIYKEVLPIEQIAFCFAKKTRNVSNKWNKEEKK